MNWASYLLSLCLHLAVFLLIMFWPSSPPVNLETPPVMISLVDGAPGGNRTPSSILGKMGKPTDGPKDVSPPAKKADAAAPERPEVKADPTADKARPVEAKPEPKVERKPEPKHEVKPKPEPKDATPVADKKDKKKKEDKKKDDDKKPEKPKKDDKKKDDKKSKPGIFQRIGRWFREMKSELKKVVWPTKSQMVNNTVIVLVCTLIVGICIWVFDAVGGVVVNGIITLVRG